METNTKNIRRIKRIVSFLDNEWGHIIAATLGMAISLLTSLQTVTSTMLYKALGFIAGLSLITWLINALMQFYWKRSEKVFILRVNLIHGYLAALDRSKLNPNADKGGSNV